MNKAPILKLFARAPRPGEAKTRLAKSLGLQKTARVAAGLIRTTTSLAVEHWPGEVRLEVWPDTHHEVFDELSDQYGIAVSVQSEGNLGDKMLTALHEGLAEGAATAVMGCDAPQCPGEQLVIAAESLKNGDNVFGPAQDGGFWLLGLTRVAPGLFAGIDWDAPQTGARTLASAASISVEFKVTLQTLFDIDTIDEYSRLEREYPELIERILGRA